MPDLDQIKQGEQVTTSALEGTGLAPRRDSERGDHRRGRSPRISDLAITALAVIWLQKQPGAAEGDLFAKGQSGNAPGPTRRFHEPGHMGCRAVALPNSVRLIHNRGNLACCSNFKVSHYRRANSVAEAAIRKDISAALLAGWEARRGRPAAG